MRRFGLLLMSSLVLAGCASSRETTLTLPGLPDNFPNHPAPEIVRRVQEATGGYSTIRSKTRLRFETPEQSGNANLNIEHKKSDSLYASVRVTFGIEGARVLVTPDSFFVYERVSKKLYYGAAAMIRVFLPTPGPLDELFPSLTGSLIPDPSAEWTVHSDSSYYYLDSPSRTERYVVDPRIWKVTAFSVFTDGGDLLEERRFSDFDRFDSAIVPRRVEASRPLDGQEIRVYHRSVELNPEDFSLSFKTGDISERILVRERTRWDLFDQE